MRKILFIAAVWGMALLLFPFSVNAGSVSDMNPRITLTGSNVDERAAGGRYVSTVNTLIKNEIGNTWDFLGYDQGTGTITVNMIEYRKKNFGQDNRQVCMQTALEEVLKSDLSRTNRNKVYNEMCALDESTSSLVRQLSDDVSADFAGAYKYFRPWSGAVGVALGGFTLFLFVAIGLSVVIDTAYLNVPMVAAALSAKAKDGGKPSFVSLEAYKAMQQAESKAGIDYVSPTGLFLKFKVKQYIIMFICILYLVSGQLFTILGVVIDYFRGFLG